MLNSLDRMPGPIVIGQPQLCFGTDGRETLSANVDGRALWFAARRGLLSARGEYFLGPALFLAWATGRPLVFDPALPLSPSLDVRSVERVIRIWNPEFAPVRIEASYSEPEPRAAWVMSSFSGGVDSVFTLVEHAGCLTHLLTMSCFDKHGALDALSSSRAFEAQTAHLRDFAVAMGKEMVAIETNAYEWCVAERLLWDYVHGAVLCCTAVALGVSCFYVPSSGTVRDLEPWGSHPLLDPRFSTAQTQVVHDAIDYRRSDKLARIAEVPDALERLQVCWHSSEKNCGTCSKCLRTMVTLNLLGVRSSRLPDVDPAAALNGPLKSVAIGNDILWDMMHLAHSAARMDVAAILANRLRKAKIAKARSALARELAGPAGRALAMRLGFHTPSRWRTPLHQVGNYD